MYKYNVKLITESDFFGTICQQIQIFHYKKTQIYHFNQLTVVLNVTLTVYPQKELML